jgi:ATP-binding cassette, subfamily B, bacterial
MMRILRSLWLLASTSVRTSPWLSLACLGDPVAGVLLLLQPLYLAWFVSGVAEHDLGLVLSAAVAFVVSVGLRVALNDIGIDARSRMQERVGAIFQARIGRITGAIPTVSHLESARYLDQLQVLREHDGVLGLALNQLLLALSNVIFVVGTLALAVTADWRLLLVAAASVPTVVGTRWAMAWRAEAETKSAEPGRLANHLLGLGLAAAPGAELRVFNLQDTIRGRLRAATSAWRAPLVGAARRQAILDIAGTALFFGVAIAVLAWMVRDAIGGTVPLASLVLALMLVGRLQATSGIVQDSIHALSEIVRTVGRYLWLLDYQQEQTRAHRGNAVPPKGLSQGIRLDHLSFTYPGADRPVLDDVCLDLPAGAVVALVGENGAGKTTLVKLLTGLYQPTAGAIQIDGVDLTDYDLTAWRTRVSGAFQDHAKFELTAGEAIGIGDLDHLSDADRINHALRAAAAEDVLVALPRGLDTQLGSHWPNGVDLSGGQWQRLAIARGMMRRDPLLLILDEPTAALDPATEHNLFNRYAAAAHDARRQGGITLLITHRFSTVAAADLVVVLAHGRIAELGTHTELIAAGGQYAHLYHLQARGYRSRIEPSSGEPD